MKQLPSFLKYKKYHKVNFSFSFFLETKTFFPLFSVFCIQAVEYGKLTFKQIESCRRTLRRGLGKKSALWIRCFTSVAVTKKPIAARMGKGKGNISHWIAPVSKGQVLFEINCRSHLWAFFVLKKARTKLPVKTILLKMKY